MTNLTNNIFCKNSKSNNPESTLLWTWNTVENIFYEIFFIIFTKNKILEAYKESQYLFQLFKWYKYVCEWEHTCIRVRLKPAQTSSNVSFRRQIMFDRTSSNWILRCSLLIIEIPLIVRSVHTNSTKNIFLCVDERKN